MGIIVSYNIGDHVEHITSGDFTVIGYEYIHTSGIKYICIGDGSSTHKYFLECELKPSGQANMIGFSVPKF